MAGDRADNGDIPAQVQELSGALDPPATPELAQETLAYRLARTADRLRQLKSRFGIRPYRVFLVHGAWSGDRRGFGQFIVRSRIELKPTPRIRDMGAVRQMLRATGRSEEGDLYVDEISATLTEPDLMGDTCDLRDPSTPRTGASTAEFWWEVEEVRPGSPTPQVRQFVPVAAPDLRRDRFQWAISLAKRDYDPGRAGDTSGGDREIR